MIDVSWAERTSLLLDVMLHDEGVEIAELLKAGVPYYRIRSLYPTAPSAYINGIKFNLMDDQKRPQLYELLRHRDYLRDTFIYAPPAVFAKVRTVRDQASAIAWSYGIVLAEDDPGGFSLRRVITNLHVLAVGLPLLRQYSLGGIDEDWYSSDRRAFDRELKDEPGKLKDTCTTLLNVLARR